LTPNTIRHLLDQIDGLEIDLLGVASLLIGINGGVFLPEKFQLADLNPLDLQGLQLLLNRKVITLVFLLQTGKDVNEIFEVLGRHLAGKFKLPDTSFLHLPGKGFKDGKSVGLYLDADTIKEKIIPDDFQEKVPFGPDEGIYGLETFLAQAVDQIIVGIVGTRPFEQAMESEDKFRPQGCREMFVIEGGGHLLLEFTF
jgi:hypothetical protein